MVDIHSVHVSRPSQHSLINSTSQLYFYSSSSTYLYIPKSIDSCHAYHTSQTLISRAYTYLLYAFLIPMRLPYTTPLLQFLPHTDASLCIYNEWLIIQQTFQHSSSFIPLIHSVYHTPFTSSICYHLRPQVLETIYFSVNVALWFFLSNIAPNNIQQMFFIDNIAFFQ